MANSDPSPDNSEKKQDFQSNTPQQEGSCQTRHAPDWLDLSLEREIRYQSWGARPKNKKDGASQNRSDPEWFILTPEREQLYLMIDARSKGKKDVNQGNPFFKGESQQEPQIQKPAPQAEQPETSRNSQVSQETDPEPLHSDEAETSLESQETDPEPLHSGETGKSQESQQSDLDPLNSDETDELHSLFETVKSTDKDEHPGALCDNIIADNSESMNNNVPTVLDSQHDIVVTNSDTPSSDEGEVHSHTNDGDPSRPKHTDAAATALMVRMDQNYTERGKRKKKRWPKPKRFLCTVFFQLRNQLKLYKDSLTSAPEQTSSPVFVATHDQRGVRLVHAHDLPSAEGRKVYYDQKASHEELQVGDKVWYYVFAPTTGKEGSGIGTLARKLMPRWTGPHLITDKLSSVVYQIKISKGQKEPIVKWVHQNQVKPYKASADSAGDKDLTNLDLVGKKVVQAGTN